MKRFGAVCLVLAVAAASASAGVTKYTDKSAWDTAVAAYAVSTINWDDVGPLADGTYQTISGDRYSTRPGSPALSVDGGGLYVGNPNNPSGGNDPSGAFYGADFFPISQSNVFSPDVVGSPEGTLIISFETPVYALGAWFLDVEGDYAGTGISVDNTGLYAFTGPQLDDSQAFLGIISTTAFTTAEIHMATGQASNGVGIDDVTYALVPLPASLLLGVFAVGLAGRKLQKFV